MNLSIFIPHWGIFARYAIFGCNKIYPIAASLPMYSTLLKYDINLKKNRILVDL